MNFFIVFINYFLAANKFSQRYKGGSIEGEVCYTDKLNNYIIHSIQRAKWTKQKRRNISCVLNFSTFYTKLNNYFFPFPPPCDLLPLLFPPLPSDFLPLLLLLWLELLFPLLLGLTDLPPLGLLP